MHFYRLEYKDHKTTNVSNSMVNAGVYNSLHMPELTSYLGNIEDDHQHPEPKADGIPYYETHHVFGFKSIEQLKQWFNLETILAKFPDVLQVGVYECHDYHLGKTQAIFNSKRCQPLTPIVPHSLLTL